MNQPSLLNFQQIDVVPGKSITVAELSQLIPFDVKRVYWVNNISDAGLSEHAHKSLHQVIIPLAGSITVELEDRERMVSKFMLDRNNIGLHIPPMHWKRIYYKRDLILLCFASESFDDGDYIRDYATFSQP